MNEENDLDTSVLFATITRLFFYPINHTQTRKVVQFPTFPNFEL